MRLPAWLLAALVLFPAAACSQPGTQLRFCIGAQPKTLNPLLAVDGPSETVRYLTGGVLIRLNRRTQQLEPELAARWQVGGDQKSITFVLRDHLRFSDGTPFTADDVVYTIQQLMSPSLHSPTADAFRPGNGAVSAQALARNQIRIVFPAPIVALDRLFDQLAILSAHSAQRESAVLGPYLLAENHAGSYLLLRRNPYYWKHDSAGRPLPYIESIRLDIQQNRDTEMLRFMRGEIDLINSLEPAHYEQLKKRTPQSAIDAGVSLDSEQMWFNQVATAPLPPYKKAWFTSTAFRQAVSMSIRRDDLVRIVFHGYAHPAESWISPANKTWFDTHLAPLRFDSRQAIALLTQAGFRLQAGVLYDREGHVVEFSIITNAGNQEREHMAAMIQQDLAAIGMHVNVVTLDFPSLIERITRSFNYEACLLGLVNDDLDPDSQMNVWLSSAENHQWNPAQKSPATPWEADIDTLMRQQASAVDPVKRKQAVDRVQEIVRAQEPFIYLVNREALAAVSPQLHNASPVALTPQVYWNIEYLWMSPVPRRSE